MTRSRFEAINAFFHVVTPQDEAANGSDPLKKVRKFYDAVKAKCLELYQPLQQLSVDERMVKSKARTHFRQFIRNKPTKWGFKFWVLADSTGFTSDCSLYCEKQRGRSISDNGLAFDVVTDILHAFDYQGYSVYFDNWYTSPTLLHALKEKKFSATGTLRTNRRGIPSSVLEMKAALSRADVPRGTGYYIRDSDDVYVCWRDNNCVCVMSNEHPGHSEGTARRAAKTSTGAYQTADVPLPATVKYYNQFMGGVDKSDQLISYHRILRQTKKYWKTIFYHLLEICITNSAILHKWHCMEDGKKAPTVNSFRDDVVLAIIDKFGDSSQTCAITDDFTPRHSSTAIKEQWKICVVCHKKCSRYCPDCPFGPGLCQTAKRQCHDEWHSTKYAANRSSWFASKKQRLLLHRRLQSLGKRVGRPIGSSTRKYFKVRH